MKSVTKNTFNILFFVTDINLDFSTDFAFRSAGVSVDALIGLPLAFLALPNTSLHSALVS